MVIGQTADGCVLWTRFDISIVARSYAQSTGILAGFAFVSPGEAWLWVGVLAVALVVQSAALSFQNGMEVPLSASSLPADKSG